MTPSRLLSRLDTAIAAATDPVTADCLRAERASYLARQGEFDEARQILSQLHERYDARPVMQVSIWLNLVEGLLSYFIDMGKASVDKLLRAHALSVAAGIPSLRALCSAWLAHIDFGLHRFDRMAHNVKEALLLAQPDQTAVLARASLVIAQALHAANRYDLAAPWYARARRHANAEGDDATISALMHNMTCMRVANWRQIKLAGHDESGRLGYELLSAESTENYDAQIGATSLNSLVPLLRAQVHALSDEPRLAIATYLDVMETAARQGMHRLFANILADRAWCYATLGDHRLAQMDAESSERSLIPDTQIDDRAAAHSRLSMTYSLLGMQSESQRHRELALAAWAEFEQLQLRIVQLLSDLPSEPK